MTSASESFQQVVGANARRLREQRGMSQDDVARRARQLGVSWRQATIANLENGRKVPTIETLVVLAASLADQGEGRLAFLADFAATDGDIQLAGEASIAGKHLVELLHGSPVLLATPDEAPAMTPFAILQAGPDTAAEDLAAVRNEWRQADVRAADRLGMSLEEAQLTMARLWGESLSARSARLAAEQAHGQPSPQRKGIITRRLSEELEADRDLTEALDTLGEHVTDSEQLDREDWRRLAVQLHRQRAVIHGRGTLEALGMDKEAELHANAPRAVDGIPWATSEFMARLAEEADR